MGKMIKITMLFVALTAALSNLLIGCKKEEVSQLKNLLGCGEEEEVVQLNELQRRGGVYVVPRTQKPYSGEFITTYENNVIKEAGKLKDGKRNGEITTYRKDESIMSIEHYRNGERHGEITTYREDGSIMSIEHYKDGKRNGKITTYRKDGSIMNMEHYIDGERVFYYYKNGKHYDKNGKLITAQLDSFTDNRDGKKYKTAKIGKQVWFAENLNYEVKGSKCYGNDPSNCDIYGRLYDVSTALGLPPSCNSSTCSNLKHKGICPSGWHLPSESELLEVLDFVGGVEAEAAETYLKAEAGWARNDNGLNSYGFSALPGGYGRSDGSFLSVGYLGFWWSATEDNASYGCLRGIFCRYAIMLRDEDYKSLQRSVRCLQD